MNAAASHYSRYDQDGLDSEEEEEERRLSELHGEAGDDAAAGPKRKRSSTNANPETKLTEEDAAAAKEFEEKLRKKKKPRPVLTSENLKSATGLIYVRRSFPTAVKTFRDLPLANKVRGTGAKSNDLARKMNAASRVNAAAQYSRSLMSNYNSFAQELFPSLAAEDVFLKIEDLGSKKDVKDYLQLMREEFRREHLGSVYGEGKAKRILHELEYGLRAAHQQPAEEQFGAGQNKFGGNDGGEGGNYNNSDDEENNEGTETPQGSPPVRRSPPKPVVNPYAKKAAPTEDVDENAGSEKEQAEKNTSSENAEPVADPVVAENNPNATEEDEEEEAAFDDDGDDNANNDDEAAETVAMEKKDIAEEVNDVADAVVTEKNTNAAEEDEEEEATFPANGDDNTANDAEASETVAEEANDALGEKADSDPSAEAEESTESGIELRTRDSENEAVATEKQNDMDAGAVPEKTSEEAVEEDPTNLVGESTDDAQINTQQNEVNESPTQLVKTQETLTLMESQLDDAEIEYTQDDDRFSQVDEEKPVAEDAHTLENDERFSQTQNDHVDETRGEENTPEERFSQFTQPSSAGQGPIFEEDDSGDDANGNVADGAIGSSGDRLGQTMDTQLSMEY